MKKMKKLISVILAGLMLSNICVVNATEDDGQIVSLQFALDGTITDTYGNAVTKCGADSLFTPTEMTSITGKRVVLATTGAIEVDAQELLNSDEFTFETWININSDESGTRRLFALRDGTNVAAAEVLHSHTRNSDTAVFKNRLGTKSDSNIDAERWIERSTENIYPYADTWKHYTFTRKWDSENSKWTTKTYIDGALATSAEESGVRLTEDNCKLYIGSNTSNISGLTKGISCSYGTVNVYAKELSAERISQLYSDTKDGFVIPSNDMEILEITPEEGIIAHNLGKITLKFSNYIDSETVSGNIVFSKENGEAVEGWSVTVRDEFFVDITIPELEHREKYKVTVKSGLESINDVAATESEFKFTAKDSKMIIDEDFMGDEFVVGQSSPAIEGIRFRSGHAYNSTANIKVGQTESGTKYLRLSPVELSKSEAIDITFNSLTEGCPVIEFKVRRGGDSSLEPRMGMLNGTNGTYLGVIGKEYADADKDADGFASYKVIICKSENGFYQYKLYYTVNGKKVMKVMNFDAKGISAINSYNVAQFYQSEGTISPDNYVDIAYIGHYITDEPELEEPEPEPEEPIDPDLILSEDFEGEDIASRISNNRDTDYTVTRVSDKYGTYELATEDDNQYIVLKDKFPLDWEGINLGRLNAVMEQNTVIDKSGTFAVEARFQIPELATGAKFYPITAFYDANNYDFTVDQSWNRGNLARFVYVENGEFKVSGYIPEDTTETTVTDNGTTIATARAGKWYTLKLIFNIDGDDQTVDTFRYELTDGVEVFAGNGGAVGNKVGYTAICTAAKYNLTALNKIAFGYVWDETSATPDTPTTIYLDDLCIRDVADAEPITLVSSSPAADDTDVPADAAIELIFSEAVTETSAQNITITPAVDATITADGNTVTIVPDENLKYGRIYTVTIPDTLVSSDGREVISESFKFKVEKDPDLLLFEDFEGTDVVSKIATKNRDLAYTVTRVTDLYAGATGFSVETDATTGNKYLKLNDVYGHLSSGSDVGRCNIAMEYNTHMNLTGEFAVETKFQIPSLVQGARYYPITAFYEEADLSGGWNRGNLARFVYVQNGEFKLSYANPADTTVTAVTDSGTAIATAEAGKWYTLKLVFDIDGDAETVDTFRYELTDGVEVYTGDGGAVGNKCGYQSIITDCKYDLTSLYKLAFGYIWDETTATETTPDSIYLDDISIEDPGMPFAMISSDPAADETNVAIDKTITLTFEEVITQASAQNITITPAVDATITAKGNTVTIDPAVDLAYETTYTVTIPNTVEDEEGANVIPTSFTFITVEDPDLFLFEDFQGSDISSRISNNRDTDYTVTRVADKYGIYELATEVDNQYIVLKDKYPLEWEGLDFGRLNVVMEQNTAMNLIGAFTVETKFQIPELATGAKFYPITAFYDEGDLEGSWNRGNLARFVYVENGEFKVSGYIPEDTTETTVTDNGTTIATAETGKWYTLKLIFYIDGDAETVDTFTYGLTDGTNSYAGNGGAVGNKVGYQAITSDCRYNLTSLYKLAFGYIWDETSALPEAPTSIYLDDISIRRTKNVDSDDYVIMVSSNPAENATDVAVDKAITLTFSEAVTNASAQNITITPAVDATITAKGNTVTIDPAVDLAYETTYTVTVPSTVRNEVGTAATATSFSFTTGADPNKLYAEDFEGTSVADRVGGVGKDLQVSRVADTAASSAHFEFVTEADNTYLKLMDKYVQPGQYDYGRLNVIATNNANTNISGEFAVETKFQIPELRDGATYYPITAFYEAADLTGNWNRGLLAKLVYVVKEGDGFSFKVSEAVPADTTVIDVTTSGTTIATAEAGKWYTLKINFNIDGNAETIDRFTYQLTDGTNTYKGLGGAVGNKCGSQGLAGNGAKYNLTSLHKLAFGYIWDETTASVEDPTTIYLDDISVRREAVVLPVAPITLVRSSPAANETDVAADKTITLTFSEAVTNASAQNIAITPAVDATITANGRTVTIDPAADLAYETTYTVTVPSTVRNEVGTAATATSFSFTTGADPDVLLTEDFQGADILDNIETRYRDLAYTVTRVTDLYAGTAGFSVETDATTGNKYLKLNDIYGHLSGGYDAGRYNIALEYNTHMNLTGEFAVETKFQIPTLVEGAKYYPITAFYEEADLAGNWNRGLLARFVYVEKEGDGFSFKVSDGVPEDTFITDVIDDGTTIATAEAGKWYTLKLNFNIDGNAETIDRFTYELTDGTNTYSGLGGAIGNKVGYQAITWDCRYNLTSLYKLAFGYIWDETTATETTPDSIYLDDISIRREAFVLPVAPITLVRSNPSANATNVAVDKTITLTFSEAVTNASAQNITIEPAVDATITADGATVTIDPDANLAFGTTYTVTIPSTVKNEAEISVIPASFSFTTVDEPEVPDDPDEPEVPDDPEEPDEPVDPDEILFENFEAADVTSKIATNNRDLAYTVTRVDTLYAGATGFSVETDATTGNKFLKLNDIYGHLQGGYDVCRCNIAMEYNTHMNLTGEFAVETKFQIPSLVQGAKYYPITAFYDEANLSGNWNRGHLAKFVYVVEESGSFVFKVASHIPESTLEAEITEGGTTIATAEAGKWYTLKLNFNIDGDAETVDRFTYELTDGINTYNGLGGAVGNKVGSVAITEPRAAKYELTSLYKLAFGYIWDETTATETTPDSIYLDDISIRNEAFVSPAEPITLVSSDPAANETDVAADKTITLTFSEAVTNASAQNITITPAVDATITANGRTVTIDPAANLAFGTTYTIIIPDTVENEAGTAATATSFSFTTAEENVIIGDVNDDGEVDFADAILMLKYDVGLINLTDDKLIAGDVNDDGEVDFSDAILVLKYDVGLITSFKK